MIEKRTSQVSLQLMAVLTTALALEIVACDGDLTGGDNPYEGKLDVRDDVLLERGLS
jgi:hypothetical protein